MDHITFIINNNNRNSQKLRKILVGIGIIFGGFGPIKLAYSRTKQTGT